MLVVNRRRRARTSLAVLSRVKIMRDKVVGKPGDVLPESTVVVKRRRSSLAVHGSIGMLLEGITRAGHRSIGRIVAVVVVALASRREENALALDGLPASVYRWSIVDRITFLLLDRVGNVLTVGYAVRRRVDLDGGALRRYVSENRLETLVDLKGLVRGGLLAQWTRPSKAPLIHLKKGSKVETGGMRARRGLHRDADQCLSDGTDQRYTLPCSHQTDVFDFGLAVVTTGRRRLRFTFENVIGKTFQRDATNQLKRQRVGLGQVSQEHRARRLQPQVVQRVADVRPRNDRFGEIGGKRR